LKIQKILLLLIACSMFGTIYMYNSLPDRVPLLRDFNGDVFKTSGKYYVLISSALPLLILAISWIALKIEPRQKNVEHNNAVRQILILLVTILFVGAHWLNIADAMKYPVNVSIIGKIISGILFMVMGNYLPVIRYNYSFGLRNPWTLASERVWTKIHRIGGRLFIIQGLSMIALVFIGNKPWIFILLAVFILQTIFIYIYSLILYRRESVKQEIGVKLK